MNSPRALLLSFALSAPLLADGEIKSYVEISDLQGGLGSVLEDFDMFGLDVASLGDLDGDGNADLIVGGIGGLYGEAWIVFLNADGTVKQRELIEPPADGPIYFGWSVANLGDVNGDGRTDVAIGEYNGEVHVHFLNPDGTVGGVTTLPRLGNGYGMVGAPGDLNGDGVPDLAVGAWGDVINKGRVYLHILNPDGTIKNTIEIAEGAGGFLGVIDTGDYFGFAVTGIGDLDGDGAFDLAVSAPLSDDGADEAGAIWILLLNPDGTVKFERKLTALSGDLDGLVEAGTQIGRTLRGGADLDGDGRRDLVVGTFGNFYLLFLNADGSVRSHLHYNEAEFGSTAENLGRGAAAIPDLDGDGIPELVVGTSGRDGGGDSRGGINVNFWGGVSPAGSMPHGCDLNPAGSLTVDADPILGATAEFSLDNPLGSQGAGTLGFLALSFTSSAGSGCGVPLAGFHMDPAEVAAELVLGFPTAVPELIGTPWAPGQPSQATVPVPQDPALLGEVLYAQGLLFDPSGGALGGTPFALTRGVALLVGI